MSEISRTCVPGIDDERKTGIKICKLTSSRIPNRHFLSISDPADAACIASVTKHHRSIEACITVVYNIPRITSLEASKVKGNRINKARENEQQVK